MREDHQDRNEDFEIGNLADLLEDSDLFDFQLENPCSFWSRDQYPETNGYPPTKITVVDEDALWRAALAFDDTEIYSVAGKLLADQMDEPTTFLRIECQHCLDIAEDNDGDDVPLDDCCRDAI
jgi:hypothetical protein